MQVLIQTQGVDLSREDQEHIRTRLREALSRFGRKALGATLHLRDVNGPRGGEDKDCQLVVQLEDSTAVIHDRGAHVRAVVDSAIHRAVQTLGRQLGKLRDRPLRAPQLGRSRLRLRPRPDGNTA